MQYGRSGDPTAPPPGTIAEVAELTDAVRIAVQPDTPAQGCAVRESGEVSCWSTNATGAVGRPRAVARPLPARARDVAMGSAHACVLTVDRAVLCWSDNRGASSAPGTSSPYEGAVSVVGLPPVERSPRGSRTPAPAPPTARCTAGGATSGAPWATASAATAAPTRARTRTAARSRCG
ncbi:MAG: hypothetical protein IPN17_18795 [Deltaproteobacteria bacterium]|nr:hypothetical protein [Deltaproteobacteria bacterium]